MKTRFELIDVRIEGDETALRAGLAALAGLFGAVANPRGAEDGPTATVASEVSEAADSALPVKLSPALAGPSRNGRSAKPALQNRQPRAKPGGKPKGRPRKDPDPAPDDDEGDNDQRGPLVVAGKGATRNKIVAFLRDRPNSSGAEIADATDLNANTVRCEVQKLVNAGTLERSGWGRVSVKE
jgi:hypothetical protein